MNFRDDADRKKPIAMFSQSSLTDIVLLLLIFFLLINFSEVLCSVLIFLGLGTRLATIPLIISSLVAAFVAHADDPFGKKEILLLYILLYITLLVMGGGQYSIDALINPRKKRSSLKL